MNAAVVNGGISHWYTEIGVPTLRPPLPGSTSADVAIVGAGLTGLWTAYYLRRLQPDLNVVLLERDFAGFGASGRNGGWLSSELAGSRERYARTQGRDGVVRLLRSMREAVDEVIDVCQAEGIDADLVRDGLIHVARSAPQLQRVDETLAYERAWGVDDRECVRLTADEVRARVHVAGALGGLFIPSAARVQPAKLVRGLADVVERDGATIHEQTTVTSIDPGVVTTDRGRVTAPIVLRCLEGFTATLPGRKRDWLPMNSSMIVTAPLSDDVAAEVGWHGAELLGDMAHGYMYAQRTADNRIALGGRGIPYRFGSRTDHRGTTQEWTIDALTGVLHGMFPALRGTPVEQAWCGVLGVPRDWCATVDLDPVTGLGTAGGYVGSGLTTTHLAGRTLADLALGRDTELTTLPWVGRSIRRWEPEPFRWLGVQAMYSLYRAADRREEKLTKTSRLARLGDLITGR